MEIKKINIMAGLSEEGGRVKVKKSIAGTSWTHATGYQNSRAQNVMFFEKPVNAVLHMADEGTIFLHGTKNSSEVFVLVSRNGAKGSYEIMEYLPEEKVFTGNALSYLVTQFFIGVIRYSERNGLIDEAVDSLGTNFATTWGNMSGGKVFFDNNTTKDVADILSVVQNYISEIGEGEINSTQPIKNYKDFKVALSSLVDYDLTRILHRSLTLVCSMLQIESLVPMPQIGLICSAIPIRQSMTRSLVLKLFIRIQRTSRFVVLRKHPTKTWLKEIIL
jgi:hypothetical protein